MAPDRLTSLLAAGADEGTGRSPGCPDEHRMAAYVDGALDAPECEELERHAAGCSHCLAVIGLLTRAGDSEATEPVPPQVLARASALVKPQPRRRWWLAPQWAAAAALVLVIPLLVQFGRNPDRGPEGQGRPESPATRNLELPDAGLQVLTPSAGATVDARRLSFRWTAVAGTPFYDVRVVTDEGDLVVEERVSDTAWQLPPQLELKPGVEYFVHVDAYPSGEKALSSDHVPFRVSD